MGKEENGRIIEFKRVPPPPPPPQEFRNILDESGVRSENTQTQLYNSLKREVKIELMKDMKDEFDTAGRLSKVEKGLENLESSKQQAITFMIAIAGWLVAAFSLVTLFLK